MVKFNICKADAEAKLVAEKKAKNDFLASFVKMPNKNYSVMKTEVTQKLYESIMGKNPSVFKVKTTLLKMSVGMMQLNFVMH